MKPGIPVTWPSPESEIASVLLRRRVRAAAPPRRRRVRAALLLLALLSILPARATVWITNPPPAHILRVLVEAAGPDLHEDVTHVLRITATCCAGDWLTLEESDDLRAWRLVNLLWWDGGQYGPIMQAAHAPADGTCELLAYRRSSDTRRFYRVNLQR